MPILLVILSFLCSQVYAQQADQLSVLEEIKSYLKSNSKDTTGTDDTIMDKSWGNANLMSSLNPFDYQTTDIIQNMLQNNSSNEDNAITKIQNALDAMTYDLTSVDTKTSIKAYSTDTDKTVPAGLSNSVTSSADKYRAALKLSDEVKSCLVYWDAGDPDKIANPLQGKVINAFAVPNDIVRTTTSLPSSNAEAATTQGENAITKVQCKYTKNKNENSLEFNGWEKIRKTELSFTANPSEEGEKVKTALDKLKTDTTSTADTAEDNLKTLDTKLDVYLLELQKSLASEIHTTLNLNAPTMVKILASNNASVAPVAPVACTDNPISGIGNNNTNLDFKQCRPRSDSTSKAADQLVNSLSGSLSALPFKRGLSRIKNSDNSHILLIAGQYLKFKQNDNSFLVSTTKEKRKSLMIDAKSTAGIQSARSQIRTNIDNLRNSYTQKLMKEELKTSGARGILQNIKDMRFNQYQYSNGSNIKFTATPTEVLQHNASWRLQSVGDNEIGDGSWIHRISTMENANLLRELLILQAQMLQMQYAIYADQQKLLAISATQVQTDPELLSFFTTQGMLLDGTIFDYLSGAKGVSGKTPIDMDIPQPNPDEITSAVTPP
jgi:hypothetical protein